MDYVRIDKYLIAVLIVFMILVSGMTCYADTEVGKDTEDILSFRTQVSVDGDNIYRYSEIITVKTPEDDYTFVRTLPKQYRGRVTNVSVKGYDYYYDENCREIQIQALDKGRKSFSISYDVSGINNYGKKKDNFDIFFLNGSELKGDDRIEFASFKINCSSIIKWERIAMNINRASMTKEWNALMTPTDCNPKDFFEYGRWKVSEEENRIRFISAKELRPGTVIKVHADFPKGFWANATEIGWTKTFSVVVLIFGILLFIGMRILFGREKEVVVNQMMLPPRDMNPLQTGYLVDGYVDDRDITAQLLHMGERGYFRIIETSRCEFEFEFLRYPDNEDQATKILFNAIFPETAKKGDIVTLEAAGKRLRKAVPQARRKTARVFRGGRAAFTTASKLGNRVIRLAFFLITASLPLMNYSYSKQTYMNVEDGLIVSCIFALGLTFLLSRVSIAYMNIHRKQVNGNKLYFKLWSAAYALFSILYIYLFRFKVDGRSGDNEIVVLSALFLILAPLMLFGFRSMGQNATYLLGGVQGFIEFIRDTEGEEVERIAEKDSGYFFRVLPYAYSFGISRRLASNYQDIDVPTPEWYIPYGCDRDYEFDVVVLNAMLSNFEEAVNRTVYSGSAAAFTTRR